MVLINTIALADSMLRQYDTVDHELFYLLWLQKLHFIVIGFIICVFIQNFKFNMQP